MNKEKHERITTMTINTIFFFVYSFICLSIAYNHSKDSYISLCE